MKIAILMSGSPRFCAGLDTFINGLTGYDTADWYCQLWENNPMPDKLGYDNFVIVADNWRIVNREWAIEKISGNLPTNHKLLDLVVNNNNLIEYPIITGQQVHHSNFQSIWKMHLGWNIVDTLRQASGIEYDLVIRARPDIELTEPLDLTSIKEMLTRNPKGVIVSNGGQHGYGYNINDIVGISTPQNMSIYTDLINHSLEYNKKGIVFHPETLLAYHLISNGLSIIPKVSTEIRVNPVNDSAGNLTVDFGRWQ